MTAASTDKRHLEIKAKNLRMALVLASVAVTFFIGFMAKMTLLAHH